MDSNTRPMFIRVEGLGRCGGCSWHIETQGHHPQCPGDKPPRESKNSPARPSGQNDIPWMSIDDEITPKPAAVQHGWQRVIIGNGYADKALKEEIAELEQTKDGGRNDKLNEAAFNLGQLVGAGLLDEHEARGALYEACRVNRHLQEDGRSMVLGTIKSGLESGKAKPRNINRRRK